MSNEYGYVDVSNINQTKQNAGVLTVDDLYDLQSNGHLGGSLQLIEEQDITSSTSAVIFDNLSSNYEVHFLTCMNVTSDTDGSYLTMQVSNDNGSSYRTSGYHYAHFHGTGGGTFSESRSTTAGQFFISGNLGTAANEKGNTYVYIYNLSNSSFYTSINHHGSDVIATGALRFMWGGGTYPANAETHDAFKLFMNSGSITEGNFKLFGIKEL